MVVSKGVVSTQSTLPSRCCSSCAMFPALNALVPFSADHVPARLCHRDVVQANCFFGMLAYEYRPASDHDMLISATEMALKLSSFFDSRCATAIGVSS